MTLTTRISRNTGLFLLFLGAALLLYHFSVPIIYGYYFQTSGLIMILMLAFMGRRSAVLLAVAYGSLQWFVMDRPLLIWVSVLEIIILSLFHKNDRRGNYLIVDAGFWLLLGTPVVVLLAHLEQSSLGNNSLLLLLILVVNGLFNALIAELLLTYIPSLRKRRAKQTITLNKILSHLAITSVMIPFVIFAIIIGWYQSGTITDRAAKLTSSIANGLEGQVNNWNLEEQRMLRLGSLIQLGRIQEMTDNYMNTNGPVQITITNPEGEPLGINDNEQIEEKPAWMTSGSLYRADHNLMLWLPKSSRFYSSADWGNSLYVYDAPLGEQSIRVHIEVPFSYFAKDIYYIYTVNFAFILGSIIAAALVCFFISRFLIRYLMNLIQATSNLPEEVSRNRRLNLNDSPILELNWIKNNFNHIACKLSAMFSESEEMHQSLEKQTEELLRQEKLLSQLAFTDTLTQLPNRNGFMKYLQVSNHHQAEQSVFTAFLFIDLDKFKEVNDTMGHAAGDELLRQVASTFKQVIVGEKAYRLAGDEFVVVLENTTYEDIDRVCIQLLEAFEQPVWIGDRPCEVSLSIGVAVHPADGFDLEHILNLSDRAMYKAKMKGGNQYVYFSDLQ